MIDWTLITLSSIILIFYLATLFGLFEVKRRVKGQFNVAFTYFTIAIFFLIVKRILNLLSEAGFFLVSYLHEILIIIISFFLLITVISFYGALKSLTDKNKKRKGWGDYKRMVGRRIGRNKK